MEDIVNWENWEGLVSTSDHRVSSCDVCTMFETHHATKVRMKSSDAV